MRLPHKKINGYVALADRSHFRQVFDDQVPSLMPYAPWSLSAVPWPNSGRQYRSPNDFPDEIRDRAALNEKVSHGEINDLILEIKGVPQNK